MSEKVDGKSEGSCIVVGYDGSKSARAAVDYAARRAGEDGRVIVVHAFGPPPDWLGAPSYQRVLDDHEGRGRALLDSLVLEGGDELLSIDYELELVGGSPAEALARVAQTRRADEIVVGSRGFGGVRAALGSVSHAIVHDAPCPVVVIPERVVRERGG